jgi:hypothetical protein
LRLSSDDIKQVDIDGDQYNLADGEWRKEGDAKKEVQAHLRAFLVDLEFAKTDEFIAINDPAVINLPSAPLHRIKLSKGGKDGNPITLDLFAVPNVEDKYFVKVTGASVIYRVARSVFKSMTPGDDIETNPLTDPGLPEPPDGTGFDEEDSAPDAP